MYYFFLVRIRFFFFGEGVSPSSTAVASAFICAKTSMFKCFSFLAKSVSLYRRSLRLMSSLPWITFIFKSFARCKSYPFKGRYEIIIPLVKRPEYPCIVSLYTERHYHVRPFSRFCTQLNEEYYFQ